MLATAMILALVQTDVRVDALRQEVVVSTRGVSIPAGAHYGHHALESYAPFRWPLRCWARGYELEMVDAHGRALSRELLHHAGVANLDRRQLAYSSVERMIGIGRETGRVVLPSSLGVPMTAGQQLVFYYALVNPTREPIEDVTLRLRVRITPESPASPRDVLPVFFDANPKPPPGTRSFDVPPGLSVTSAEFTLPVGGYLRAAGGHLHDYAVEVRLEDVTTGKRLARLTTKRHADGRLISVSSNRFVFKRRGLRLAADRRYRVVAVYDNPTGETIADGAMAFIAGPFIPDDVRRWPAVDRGDAAFEFDRAGLLGESGAAAPHRH
jgi:hypothetical protein